MVELNSKAPDFKLIDSNLKHKTLADYKGNKTVLLFFPGAFTGVCTKEMCTFRDSMSKFNNLKAKVVGISVDQPFSLAQFAKENNLNFDLLSDATREVSKKYESLHNDFVNVPGLTASKRSVFILDQNGVVKYKWISDNPGVEPNYAEIEKELSKF
ncbi:MAG: redoxin domain-containing protein [Candidatus Thermoplasmatota archaeon]|nr:redoxin domain-containing protein [Candidatus Thermoplasmatota archaeon]